jgi:hypothetical protein
MNETLQSFIQSIKERNHVLLLIENTVLTVEFKIKDEITAILLKNGEVMIEAGVNHANTCRIHGEKEKIKGLIMGKEKLRTLILKGDLHCSAPFRTILMLESFFYLGKSDLFITKIC